MNIKRNNEKREYLHTHNKLNYIGSFCSNTDFLSKNAFFFFSNFKMLINYFLLEANVFFFYLLTYLILNVKYLLALNIKYLIRYLKLVVQFILYIVFIILIKIIFFINLFFNKLNIEHFKILLIKDDLLRLSTNVLNIYKYPVILLELFFKFLKIKNLKNNSNNSYYYGYKKLFIEKKIKLNNIIFLFYKILLQTLGKSTKHYKKNLEKYISCLRNEITKNLLELYSQIILNSEILKTLNLQYIKCYFFNN